ncbi:ribose 5-phosphate isomerase B [Dehalogenimonas etheniformans]|uniref:Ribose 5-phosphate isomerase B n=1 Tax=Dehalogenimonas etheniformans TaxID=1536648 RepID=A0A2P5P672_9CHLR|nr:ribose 5-phosphate isomerase B [Dehalogenimonas etheniformans]PPD57794.1 ribose 5-phosphate isomerase B [Dehalogenimonas etheniformans]QNT76135.1 ribose 5-phosphate isomerase B [Dehalogenimonas etheniformans]
MRIAIGNDHRGYELKLKIVEWLKSQGYEVTDVGAFSEESADYPDFAAKVAKAVAQGQAERGVLICGTGIGMSMSANKMPGIRAALVYKPEYAALTRMHNDANVLCLGEMNGDDLNMEVLKVFMGTQFEGGRHQRRIDKIQGRCC